MDEGDRHRVRAGQRIRRSRRRLRKVPFFFVKFEEIAKRNPNFSFRTRTGTGSNSARLCDSGVAVYVAKRGEEG